MRSLENAGGVHSMVVPSAGVQFPGVIVGKLTGGESLRLVLPKEEGNRRQSERCNDSQKGADYAQPLRVSGYGVKLVYDVPIGKHNGQLDVRVCWHNVVYQTQVEFVAKYLRF